MTTTAAASPKQRSSTGLGAWSTVLLVALGAAVAQSFGRFSYGVLLPAIAQDLNLSNTAAGLIGTVNVGAYLFGTIVVAAAAAHLRLIDILRIGFIYSLVGMLLAWFAQDAFTLALGLFLTGMGGALIWIPSPVIAADSMPPERRPVAVALMGSGIGTGIVFTSQLSAFIRNRAGDGAWRTVYGVETMIGIAAFALTLAFVRHSQVQPRQQRSSLGGFAVLRRMTGWLPLTLAYTAYGFCYLLIIGYLTKRLEEDSGWTSSDAATAFTVLGIAVIGGGPLFIWLARRFGPRRALAGAFALWSITALSILPGWTAPTMVAAATIGMLFAAVPAIITLYVVEHTSVADYGPSFAAATLAFGVAQMLAPQVGGALADLTGSFTVVFVLSAIIAIAGTIAALFLPRSAGFGSAPR